MKEPKIGLSVPRPRPPEGVLILNPVKPYGAMKNWYKSKTILLGALQFALGLSELVSQSEGLLGSEAAGLAATAFGALTIAVRFVTKVPVGK